MEYLELADYRRQVAELYAGVRQPGTSPQARWEAWRAGRDRLFATHAQSALDPAQRQGFQGLRYFPYNPGLRFLCPVEPVEEAKPLEISLEEDGSTTLQRIGQVRFEVEGREAVLSLFWIQGYGGGLFLPFRDATSGHETYGGGRYLLDTRKGADLGSEGERLVLDFNFAYNPSCAYNPRWSCPLAPPENRLAIPLPGGEQLPELPI